MNNYEECYQGDKVIGVSYWLDKEILNVVLKLNELHFNLRGIEIAFISGRKLIIDADGKEQGLTFSNESLVFNCWNGEAVKVDMSQHAFFQNLINNTVTEAKVLWCKNQWKPLRNDNKSYKQEYIIKTENKGYLLCSSTEIEGEVIPTIYLIDTDENVIITDENIAKENELEKYGIGEYKRNSKP